MKLSFTSILTALFLFPVFAQQKPDILNYINRYKHIAIEEMVRSRVPASITMAQGILESSCGKSPLAREANNHFGIKCKDEWGGKRYYQDDDDPNECFRVYAHAEASYADHSDFLLTRSRYAPLFQLPVEDYKSWARGLKSLGYATNPHYAEKLITYIETYHLVELDKIALAEIEGNEKLIRYPDSETAEAKPEKKVLEVIPSPAENTVPVNEAVQVTAAREEYKINGVKVVKAVGYEDPIKIAFEFNLDYSDVMIFNDLNTGERFKGGEYIYLQSKQGAGEEAIYAVKPGESMRDISQRYGIKLKDLYQKNLMKPNDQVYEGEVLYLQEKRTSPPHVMNYSEFLATLNRNGHQAQSQNPQSSKYFPDRIKNFAEYQVQQTDTLYSIAKKFNTTVEQLKKLNNLASTELQTGQTLVVTN